MTLRRVKISCLFGVLTIHLMKMINMGNKKVIANWLEKQRVIWSWAEDCYVTYFFFERYSFKVILNVS